MEDNMIVELYWKRDENAIQETKNKYEHYLYTIAYHILYDHEETQESLNDTYLKAWQSIPPQRPTFLSTYLGKITRQVSIDMYRKGHRKKRIVDEYTVSLSELEECVTGTDSTKENVNVNLLSEAISQYLYTLPSESRQIFVRRYYYIDSIKELAQRFYMSESKVKSLLYRTRQGLKNYLIKEGFEI